MGTSLKLIVESVSLTKGEKGYILDCLFRMGGSFSRALYNAIQCADQDNLDRLAQVFPDEVQGFLAWSRGDLHDRVEKIIGPNADIVL